MSRWAQTSISKKERVRWHNSLTTKATKWGNKPLERTTINRLVNCVCAAVRMVDKQLA